MNPRTLIIAEAGINHNGDISLAKRLVDEAKKAGADVVKFQTWKTELLVTKDAKQAEYQEKNTGKTESQFDMLKKLELSYDDFIELRAYCDESEIIFLSTPDEEESADFLNEIQSMFKIGSGELNNIPFLKKIARFGKPIILSTGMGTIAEVESAINAILEEGLTLENLTILHATTDYPTSFKDVNLSAMNTMSHTFPGLKVGYSDHTIGIEIPIAAVALGATVIEKHFTVDKLMEGPDHAASILPHELKSLVDAVRNIEMSLGTGWKTPVFSELKNKNIVRKSIVASRKIQKGEFLSMSNLCIRRPGGGLAPAMIYDIIGSGAIKDFSEGEMIIL